jgi:tRNA 2-thiouridine synthesizing protein A
LGKLLNQSKDTMNDPTTTEVLSAPGLACISLTPLIRSRIRTLAPGDVLEVRTDDPAAREGIPAWCRLTKNQLLDTVEHNKTNTTFFIETKEKS